jgi:isopentenyl diphosphate isomerase/L-lactate dehydrogenase-like FMN-dependent dehydrogenase
VAVDIAELEQRARRLLAPEVYDYYAGGSGSERTLRASVSAWQEHWLVPRVLRDVSTVDTSVRLPGLPETVARTPVGGAHRIPGPGQPRRRAGHRPRRRGAGALMIVSSRCSRRLERAAGVIVSNHGGRQLDRAVPTALALPAVTAELDSSAGVFADGGLRTGKDALAALGLGARAVFLAARCCGRWPVAAPTVSGICSPGSPAIWPTPWRSRARRHWQTSRG